MSTQSQRSKPSESPQTDLGSTGRTAPELQPRGNAAAAEAIKVVDATRQQDPSVPYFPAMYQPVGKAGEKPATESEDQDPATLGTRATLAYTTALHNNAIAARRVVGVHVDALGEHGRSAPDLRALRDEAVTLGYQWLHVIQASLDLLDGRFAAAAGDPSVKAARDLYLVTARDVADMVSATEKRRFNADDPGLGKRAAGLAAAGMPAFARGGGG